MGMAMGHGMMPNVPIGVPPPAMQGLLMPPTGQMMHQQMIGGVPQPVNSPFGAGREYGYEHLAQIIDSFMCTSVVCAHSFQSLFFVLKVGTPVSY
jgi:hypothetical protein